MRINYISHAALYCELPATDLLTDPWLAAPAYLNQWHIRPFPAEGPFLHDAEHIAISHGHEDHLHVPTLRRANADATVFYPLQFKAGSDRFFRDDLGFRGFVETPGNRSCRLPGGARLTFHPVGHDAIIVIESDGQVLVNVNDALHAAPVDVIGTVTAWLGRRYPRIDYLFCGYGGASFFPNCFHVDGKDDFATACVREELFARNFCLITHALQPRIAVPFAADFALLDARLAWINDTRFDRTRMAALYRALFPDDPGTTDIIAMQPGDALEDGILVRGGAGISFIPDDSAPVAAEAGAGSLDFDETVAHYQNLIAANARDLAGGSDVLPVALRIVGENREASINVAVADNEPAVTVTPEPPREATMVGRISADNAAFLLDHPWHSDVAVIGYGMEVDIRDPAVIPKGGVELIEDLVTDYPDMRRVALRQPLRVLRYVLSNHLTFVALKRRFAPAAASRRFRDVARADWLTASAATLRARLCLPGGLELQTASARGRPGR